MVSLQLAGQKDNKLNNFYRQNPIPSPSAHNASLFDVSGLDSAPLPTTQLIPGILKGLDETQQQDQQILPEPKTKQRLPGSTALTPDATSTLMLAANNEASDIKALQAIKKLRIPEVPKDIPNNLLNTARAYIQKGGKIDNIHNPLLQHLGAKPEYRNLAIPTYFNKPLHTDNIDPKLTVKDPVRDYIRITKNNVTLNNITFDDSIQFSSFAKAFDKTIAGLNKHLIAESLKANIQKTGSNEQKQFFNHLQGRSDEKSSSQIFNGMLTERLTTKVVGKRLLTPFSHVAHRDFAQPAPRDLNLLKQGAGVIVQNSQFGGAIQSGLTMLNPRITSVGKLQGIFASDGAFKSINISGDKSIVKTNGKHQIHFSGLLGDVKASGTPDENTSILNIRNTKLWPMRLGGDANIFVVGFSKGSAYQYGKNHAGTNVTDLRTDFHQKKDGQNKSYTFYTNFNMERFHEILADKTVNKEQLKRTNQKLNDGKRPNFAQDIQTINLTAHLVRESVQQLVNEKKATQVFPKGEH